MLLTDAANMVYQGEGSSASQGFRDDRLPCSGLEVGSSAGPGARGGFWIVAVPESRHEQLPRVATRPHVRRHVG